MPGPSPMHHSARQRRNKTSTAAELAVLPAEDRRALPVPELPADRLWDPATQEFWRRAWQSPMRLEWDESDYSTLEMLAVLVDEFHIEAGARAAGDKAPSVFKLTNLVSTINATGRRLGLDPFARRSLQWILVQTERDEADRDLKKARTAKARAASTKKGKGKPAGGFDALG